MIVVMSPRATKEQIAAVSRTIEEHDLQAFVSVGQERTIIGVVGTDIDRVANIGSLPGVDQVIRVTQPYKLASVEHHRERTRVVIGGVPIGADDELVVVGGPCSVESREMLLDTARWVRHEGGRMLRGGAFKPRTSPYTFQGLGRPALEMLAEAREETGLPVISEVTDAADVPAMEEYVDVLQVGSRNMHNFVLLRAVGKSSRPVLLKRGFGATIEEWLMAAEYVLSSGNSDVILCERGIRTFETATRNTLDLSAVPVLRRQTHLPIAVDPSHGTGQRDLVTPMALGAAAVGADMLLVEVHPDPPRALSDGPQSLDFGEFGALMDELRRLQFVRNGKADRHAVGDSHESAADSREQAGESSAGADSDGTAGSNAGADSDGRRGGDPAIGDLRARIDDLDARIGALLQERAAVALEVHETRGLDRHGHDPARERELIERAASGSNGPLAAEDLTAIWGAILRASRNAQRRRSEAHVLGERRT